MNEVMKKLLIQKIKEEVQVDVVGNEIFMNLDGVERGLDADEVVKAMHANYCKTVTRLHFSINGTRVVSKKVSTHCPRFPDTLSEAPVLQKLTKVTQYVFQEDNPIAAVEMDSKIRPVNWAAISKYKKIWDQEAFLKHFFDKIRWVYAFRHFKKEDFPLDILKKASVSDHCDFWDNLRYKAWKSSNKLSQEGVMDARRAIAKLIVDHVESPLMKKANWAIPKTYYNFREELLDELGLLEVAPIDNVPNFFWLFPIDLLFEKDDNNRAWKERKLGGWLHEQGFRIHSTEVFPTWGPLIKRIQ